LNKFFGNSKTNALLYPISAIKYLRNDKDSFHKKIIFRSARFFFENKFDSELWEKYYAEILSKDYIPFNEKKEFAKLGGNRFNSLFSKWMYCALRHLKPEVVIETGVAHGYSSWLILNALNKNEYGKLYSIDLPNMDFTKGYQVNRISMQPGWVVPNELMSRWVLDLGDSKTLLPNLVNKLDRIDVFFHDSDHSYESMKFEFDCVLPKIKKQNGIIFSDDIYKSTAFDELVNKFDGKAVYFSKGGICKPD